MKRTSLLIIILIILPVFFIAGCKPPQNNGVEEPVISKFDEVLDFMERKLSESGVPGGAIAVITNGTLSHSAGVGVKRQGTEDPVNSNTLFLVCSTAKMLCAGGIMTLVQEDKIDLYTPVTDYVPYFQLLEPHDPSSINVHQLLTHSSGLLDFDLFNCDTDSEALSRWWLENTDLPLWFPPGGIWLYSNPGYSFVGLILEEVSGINFIEAMQQRIFDPLRMTGATYEPKEVYENGNYAVGHTFNENREVDQFVEPDTNNCAFIRPPGQLFASAVDMAHFVEMLLARGGNVLTSDSIDKMIAPHVDTRHPELGHYGYGLQSSYYKDLKVVWHPGATNAFQTTVYFVPKHKFGVVVLLNATLYSPHTIARKAIDIFLDLPDTLSPDYSTPTDTWHIYTGKYLDPYFSGEIDVYQDSENKLWADFIDFDYTTQLFQNAGDWFYFPKDPNRNIGKSEGYITVTFFPDSKGIAEYFATRLGVGKRVEDNSGSSREHTNTFSR